MARILENTNDYPTGLYDEFTGVDYPTKKVVDITEDCPKASKGIQIILIYTRNVNGPIVQMVRMMNGNDLIPRICFHTDDIEDMMDEESYGSYAEKAGLLKQVLCELIKQNAPSA